MKLMLVMYSGSRPHLVPQLLDQEGVHGYTELRGAHGAGRTGRHEGTRAWGFVLGDLGELFTGGTKLGMYACKNCGYVEFFVPVRN